MRTLQEMVNDRMSTWGIAKEMGISQTAIRYRLKKLGLKTNPATKTVIIGGKKECPQCKQLLDVNNENFYIDCNNKVHAWCKRCNNRISYERQLSQKKRAVEYKGGKCCICTYSKYSGALDFHHLDPTEKEFSISDLRTYTWEKLKKELDKCILVCRNCHAELHGKVVGLPDWVNRNDRL